MIKLYNVHPELDIPGEVTVVGSSKIILKKKFGRKIDKSNFIVRFNFANTYDFTEHTGFKTNLMVINNHVYSSIENSYEMKDKLIKYLVISPRKLKKFKSNLNYFAFEGKINQLLLSFKFINYYKIFLSLILILIRKNFSVGFCFILLAIASGVKLKVFGFDLNENMKKREHYYKKQKIGGFHDLTAEHKILKNLKDLDKIKIY